MTSLVRPLAAYELVPLPSLTDAQLDAIVARHGIELDEPVAPLTSSGVVHSLWSLGSRFVLRVPKDEAMCLGDHLCEAVAIPLALRAGLRTPAIQVFDDSRSILDVPFTIVSRVHGTDLSAAPFDHPAYEHVGRALAALHTADLSDDDHLWLRRPYDPPAEELARHVVEAGLLHVQGVEWIQSLCERLDEAIASGAPAPRTFLHGDVKPDNVMVEPHGAVQLIDWGDAGFGDPAFDFQSLPMRSIELALRGYRELRADDPTLEPRIVRRVVGRCLANLGRTPRTGPSWYRPVAANLTELLTFAIDRRDTWESWLRA